MLNLHDMGRTERVDFMTRLIAVAKAVPCNSRFLDHQQMICLPGSVIHAMSRDLYMQQAVGLGFRGYDVSVDGSWVTRPSEMMNPHQIGAFLFSTVINLDHELKICGLAGVEHTDKNVFLARAVMVRWVFDQGGRAAADSSLWLYRMSNLALDVFPDFMRELGQNKIRIAFDTEAQC